ncbi:hypothetical protein EU244_027900 [Rhodococcus qingshengii]|uniref:hypothetical protein n=1 Tax=Rhodococcus qingshengii TaxID=334542 RepID=UPI0010A66038|nr:hypothetical protein [Rhodococcus qingshengii]THJ66917.1 hypothetical protein EU244_27230 [Rhodococcus qingshengii]
MVKLTLDITACSKRRPGRLRTRDPPTASACPRASPLIIDWATVGGLHLFCAAMAYSRWRIAAVATDEKATTTMTLIAEVLAAVGGVLLKVLADRMAGHESELALD